MEHLLTTQGWFLSVIYTHGPMLKMKEFIHPKFKKKKKNSIIIFYQWKRITKFNDSLFKIKVYTPNFNREKIWRCIFEKVVSGVKISYRRCSKWNHKVSFQHLKQNLISNNTFNDINKVNLSSTNLVNVNNNGNHELNAPQYS